MKYILSLFAVLLLLSSCKKELSLEGYEPVFPEPPVVDTVETFPRYHLTAFYSDIPIDFIEDDENPNLETDLWAYVHEYIKDDEYVFLEDGLVEIHQNDVKMPGLDDEILYREYSYGSDDAGDFINYLSATYEPLTYRLYEKSETHFVIGLKWKSGSRVFSRFELIE